MLKALYEVVSKAGPHMNENSRASILGLIESESGHVDGSMNVTNARLMGALVKSLPSDANAANLIKQRVLTSHITSSSILNLNSVLLESPTSLTKSFKQETAVLLCQGISSKNVGIWL